jgi:predicted  nucleic acid-binding Zn-ribbon protein
VPAGQPISAKEIWHLDSVGELYAGDSQSIKAESGEGVEQRILESVGKKLKSAGQKLDVNTDKKLIGELSAEAYAEEVARVKQEKRDKINGENRAKASAMSPQALDAWLQKETANARKPNLNTDERTAAEDCVGILTKQAKINEAAVKYADLVAKTNTKYQQFEITQGEVRRLQQEKTDLPAKLSSTTASLTNAPADLQKIKDAQQVLQKQVTEAQKDLESAQFQLKGAREGMTSPKNEGLENIFALKINEFDAEVQDAQQKVKLASQKLAQLDQGRADLERRITAQTTSLTEMKARQTVIDAEITKSTAKRDKEHQEYLAATSDLIAFQNTTLYSENKSQIKSRGTLESLAQGTTKPESLELSETLSLHQFVEDMAKTHPVSTGGSSSSSSSSQDQLAVWRSRLWQARDHHLESYDEKMNGPNGFNPRIQAANTAGDAAKAKAVREEGKPWEELRATYAPNQLGAVQMSLRLAKARTQGLGKAAFEGSLNEKEFGAAIEELQRRKTQKDQDATFFTPLHRDLLDACERQKAVNQLLLGYLAIQGGTFAQAREIAEKVRAELAHFEKEVQELENLALGKVGQWLQQNLPKDLADSLTGNPQEIKNLKAEAEAKIAELRPMLTKWELIASFEHDPDLQTTVNAAMQMGKARQTQQTQPPPSSANV